VSGIFLFVKPTRLNPSMLLSQARAFQLAHGGKVKGRSQSAAPSLEIHADCNVFLFPEQHVVDDPAERTADKRCNPEHP
jgi:hypothetical protein